jgi:hypothetical protein
LHIKVIFAVLLLTMFLTNMLLTTAEAAEPVDENEDYVRIETTRAIYLINKAIANNYSNQTLSGFINDVDERFRKTENITGWSSERFYSHKLQVTADLPSKSGLTYGATESGYVHIFWGKEFPLTNATARLGMLSLFLDEMFHGITPQPFITSKWLAEGLAVYFPSEVQVMFGDRSRETVDGWYVDKWKEYMRNGYIDSFNNKSIQDGGGYYITAWMLNNITETYGWKIHERFFASLPDEYMYSMPNFFLSTAEASSYKYYFDSLIVGYYSLAAGTSLFSTFKSWGVNVLPNPITIVCLNGTLGQNSAYTSGVTVSLSAAGENAIDRIEYSFDRETWNTYSEPFLVSENRIIYYRSIDGAGNTGITASISPSVESNNPITPRPEPESFPTILIIAFVIAVSIIGVGLLVYFKKRKD